jgi:hypothetical protein
MAGSKKNKSEEVTTMQDSTYFAQREPSAGGMVSYSGKVTIKYRRKGKTYKSYSSHNVGYSPLFSFIGRCLAQDYRGSGAPYGLRLFSISDVASFDVKELTADNERTTNIVQKAATSIAKNNDDGSITVNFSFIVPFTVLAGEANVLALYSADSSDSGSIGSPLAVFLITDTGNYISSDGDSNVVVVWSMTISNK